VKSEVIKKEKRKVQWLKFYDPNPEAENSLEAPNLRSRTATWPSSGFWSACSINQWTGWMCNLADCLLLSIKQLI